MLEFFRIFRIFDLSKKERRKGTRDERLGDIYIFFFITR